MKNKSALIFDLDGVIVDTAKFHFTAWQKLAQKIGVIFTEKENEQLKGVSRVKSLEKILAWGNMTISDDLFQRLMEEKNQDYLRYVNAMDVDEILPGVKDFLDAARAEGHPIALGSASKNARTILTAVKLLDRFDVIIDGNQVTKGKPDPEGFLKASEQLNSQPYSSVVFEDSIAGIQAANTGGMTSIGIGQKSVLNEADYCFKGFDELTYSIFSTISLQEKINSH